MGNRRLAVNKPLCRRRLDFERLEDRRVPSASRFAAVVPAVESAPDDDPARSAWASTETAAASTSEPSDSFTATTRPTSEPTVEPSRTGFERDASFDTSTKGGDTADDPAPGPQTTTTTTSPTATTAPTTTTRVRTAPTPTAKPTAKPTDDAPPSTPTDDPVAPVDAVPSRQADAAIQPASEQPEPGAAVTAEQLAVPAADVDGAAPGAATAVIEADRGALGGDVAGDIDAEAAPLALTAPAVDESPLSAALGMFLEGLDDLGRQIAQAPRELGVPFWIVAAALAGGACEAGRRQWRRGAAGPCADAADAAGPLHWTLGLPEA